MAKKATDPFQDVTEHQLRTFLNRKDLIHFTCLVGRPGLRECSETLENTHYPPGTPANNKFFLHIYMWCDLPWIIISIPLEDKKLMKRAAAASGMKIADGVPMMIGPRGITYFPFQNKNLFTLENTRNHPVYKHQRWET